MLLANEINKPMENSIRLGFINDARRIVKESPSLDVIGVTGSYGKTSTKHALNAILSEQFNTLMTPESYNTPMGITITIRNYLKPIHSKFIAEMGAYKVGEINELCEIAYPKYGVLTSVGPQHLETFKTIDNVKQTKFELIEYLPEDGIGFINIDDENTVITMRISFRENVRSTLMESNVKQIIEQVILLLVKKEPRLM